MIAIDTNVLLRYLLADDVTQHKKAKTVINRHNPVLITDVVLAETIWTLTGKRYNLDKVSVEKLIHNLLRDGFFVFENNQVIWSALRDFEESEKIRGKDLDFVDSLIVNKSYSVAKQKGTDLSDFYSFDKAVEQLDGTKKL